MIVKLFMKTIETVQIKMAQALRGCLFETGDQSFVLTLTSHICPKSSDPLRIRSQSPSTL